MRAAAYAQQQLPNLHVVIAGDDRMPIAIARGMSLEVKEAAAGAEG